MRQLTCVELDAISGGMYCTDIAGLKKMFWSAVKDGCALTAILSPVSGTAVYVAATYVMPEMAVTLGVGTAVISAPIFFGYGLVHSSVWDLLS